MNTESTLEDSLSGDYLYAQVTELIGELSWGIGLPTVMNVGIIDPLTKEVQRIAVSGTSQKPYFAAIYDKVRANIKYNPLKTERDKVYRLEQQNAELLSALIEANEEINLLRICDQGGDAHVGDYNDLIAKAKAGVVK